MQTEAEGRGNRGDIRRNRPCFNVNIILLLSIFAVILSLVYYVYNYKQTPSFVIISEKPVPSNNENRDSEKKTSNRDGNSVAGKVADSSPDYIKTTAPVGKSNDKYFARVNINLASEDELICLPGIGREKARRILEHRKQNGPFRNAGELMNVKGIGKKIMERIGDMIIVEQAGK